MSVTLIRPLDESESWRRQGCDERCWRAVVLVVGEGQTRPVEAHDADAHEDYIREAMGAARPTRYRGAIQIGPLRVDLLHHTVSVLGMPVALTRTEWRLLKLLVSNAGRLLPHYEIVEAIWGDETAGTRRKRYAGSSEAHLVRVNLSRLRKKLWEAGALIESVAGEGYRLRLALPEGGQR